ncbi:capZ-interacting protein isoform X7 [Callorhinus ursinus]|uniref:CapZ-interacting protein isoform X5 n=1 Tax=Callorhinus ursinus TaxID=34884 RepID=A0A3Q7R062_CALUR|nr:capZ-interacting protein isoform X5 [Callorhinus ursinus]
MEDRSAESGASVDDSASPSVAQLAGRFREQAAAAKETPACKPTRRKPPCSLPLFPPKVELGQNGEEKSSPNASHPPKIKVKSSPLIEKLQANLAFDPAALLPGASPKSPGLKAAASPFQSPPSTPSSPGVRSQEPEEVPVSFDQPPEGSHLPCYNKVRTKGSIKRRPPSRRFRRSQSDCGDLGDFRAPESSQENGAKEENGNEVFPSKSKALASPPPGEGPVGEEVGGQLGSQEKPPLRRTSSRTEKQEEKGRAVDEAQHPHKAVGGSEEEASPHPAPGEAVQPAQASNPEAANGGRSPREEKAAGKETAKSEEVKVERAGNEEEEARQRNRDPKGPVDGAVGEASPSPPEGGEGPRTPEQSKGEEGAILEPGCNPHHEAPKTKHHPFKMSDLIPSAWSSSPDIQPRGSKRRITPLSRTLKCEEELTVPSDEAAADISFEGEATRERENEAIAEAEFVEGLEAARRYRLRCFPSPRRMFPRKDQSKGSRL